MRNASLKDGVKKRLAVVHKRDPRLYAATKRKIHEILTAHDVTHYKNLRAPLQAYKRVHVLGPFILTFRHDPKTDTVEFVDFDHHDNIYEK